MLLEPESKVLKFFPPHLYVLLCFKLLLSPGQAISGEEKGGTHFQFGGTLTSDLCLHVPIIISFQRSHKSALFIRSRVYTCIQWGDRMECAYSILPRTRTPESHIFY